MPNTATLKPAQQSAREYADRLILEQLTELYEVMKPSEIADRLKDSGLGLPTVRSLLASNTEMFAYSERRWVPAARIAGVLIDVINTASTLYISGVGFVVLALVMARLKIPHIPRGSLGNPLQDINEGLQFIKKNSIFSFLIGMTFFNSFFGMAYVMLMPIFAVDILEVGARGQGLLLTMTGAGALINTLWMGARGSVPNRGWAIIGGAVFFGFAVTAFALTAEYVGSLSLAMALMFIMGVFNSVYMISIQSSLQIMVPDRIRGRVMGFYGMTWSIMPLGGLQASALTSLFTAPIAIAAGGLAVALFALGTAAVNPTVRALSSHLSPIVDDFTEAQVPSS